MFGRIQHHSQRYPSHRSRFRADRSMPQLSNQAKVRIPLFLPQINSKRHNKNQPFYDELLVSPEYVKISKKAKGTNRGLSQLAKESRGDSFLGGSLLSNRRQYSVWLSQGLGSRILPIQQLAEQDRILQKHQQNNLKYKKIVSNIKRRVRSNHQKQNKKGLQLIYDRLMKLL